MQQVALKDALVEAVKETVQQESSIAVAFSGGIDSSLLAKISSDLGIKVMLITVGFPGSPDTEFSKIVAGKLCLPHKVVELEKEDFYRVHDYVWRKLSCKNLCHIENCIAFFYLANLAHQNGVRLLLSANGCDELFCGYDTFRRSYKSGNDRMMQLIRDRIRKENILMREIGAVTVEFGIKCKHPFLSEKFISHSFNVSINDKIRGHNDLIRKHILREVAVMIGVPEEAAYKPKKALQYGSLIHKNLRITGIRNRKS